MAASKPAEDKIVDVNKPGSSSPDASGRPVVVSHKPMVQDPMMAKPKTSQDEAAPAPQALAGKGKTITPPKGAEAASTQPKTQPEAEGPNVIDTGKTEAEAPKKAEETNTKDAPKTGNTPIDQDLQKKKELAEAEAAEKEANEKYEKLIADKTYFAPITQAGSSLRSVKIVAVAVLLGVIAFAAMTVFM